MVVRRWLGVGVSVVEMDSQIVVAFDSRFGDIAESGSEFGF